MGGPTDAADAARLDSNVARLVRGLRVGFLPVVSVSRATVVPAPEHAFSQPEVVVEYSSSRRSTSLLFCVSVEGQPFF